MKIIIITVIGWLVATTLPAQTKPEFPSHWGTPPARQVRDLVELPGGYGRGSSTLRQWIETNLTKEQPGAPNAAAQLLYANDFTAVPPGQLPDDFLVLGGAFSVQAEGTNHVLALPGAPLDSFGLQFGPAPEANVAVTARVLGTSKGRRAPTFGVGLGGVSGWKLQVAPGKKALELLRDAEVQQSVPFDWQSGVWTELRLELQEIKSGTWQVSGQAWSGRGSKPELPQLKLETTEPPPAGRPSVLGSPFAGTPIWYDDLKLEAGPAAQGTKAAR